MSSLPSGVTMERSVVLTPAISAFLSDLRKVVPSSIPLHLTSGARTSARQAAAMATKVAKGENLRKLYADDFADAVTAVYPNQARMAAVIDRFKAIGRGSDHLQGNAVDLRSYILNSSQIQTVVAAGKRLGGSGQYETTPAHIHLSVPKQYRGAVASSGRSGVSRGGRQGVRRSSGSSELVWTGAAIMGALVVVAGVAVVLSRSSG